MNQKTKSFLGLLIILVLFFLSSYFVRTNIEFLKELVGNNMYGILAYFIIIIIAIVIAPIGMVPLIPVASNIYGWFLAGVITVIGWTIGSIIVFVLCRAYGVDLIKKLISLKEIQKFESKIPKKNLFIDLILLRMIIPVDILSYAIGLLTKIDFKMFVLTTIIGVIPFAFIFSYLGTMPLWYQIGGFIIVVILIAIIHIFRELKSN